MFIKNPTNTILIIVKEALLIYPYTDPNYNKSIFRFPPLGLGYIAAYLKEKGVNVSLLDCTFRGEESVIQKAKEMDPLVIGIYSMFTMRDATFRIAKKLRNKNNLLVAGGPLPSVEPELFLETFDIVAIGEGEETMFDIMCNGFDVPNSIDGIVYRSRENELLKSHRKGPNKIVYTKKREPIKDLDDVPLPARELFDNDLYQKYYTSKGLSTTTSIMTSRGCPFSCDFCSRAVFGNYYRERSARNIVDEVQEVVSLGYEKVFFQDDCFTLTKDRVKSFCNEVNVRGIEFKWDCLSRVDSMDKEIAYKMKKAGCEKIFFGIESGNNEILKIMKKSASTEQARDAVNISHSSGIKTGGFFILGYPGETEKTILQTIDFALSLPLDYLSFSLPYPIPGTGLYEKTNGKIEKKEPKQRRIINHELIYESNFSDKKLRFAIFKGATQFHLKKKLGKISPIIEVPFDIITNTIFNLIS